ncbi:MAG: DUF4349 domain-containing protein [Labilithrix sp.]
MLTTSTTTQKPSVLVLLALAFALVAFAAGCANKAAPASASEPSAIDVPGGKAAAPSPSGGSAPKAERSRITTMNVTIVSDRFDDSMKALRASVDRAGGYVSDLQSSGAGDDQQARFEIRVPADRAQEVRGSLAGLGEITNQNEKVEDVTEQRADLDARIANARTQEKRLLEIMATKSGSINDLVESEKELARVRENIERLEAQQRTLVGKVDYATIHVTLMARAVPAWQTPGTSLVNAGKSGVRGAAAVAVYGSMVFLTVAPTMLPIATLVFVVYLIARRRRSAMAIDPTAA